MGIRRSRYPSDCAAPKTLVSKRRMNREQAEISEKLSGLRMLRFASHFPWLAVFVIGFSLVTLPISWKHFVLPFFHGFFIWAVVGFFLSFRIRPFPCPRCGEKFHYRKYGKGVFSPYAYNDFARKCMHCDLKIDGSNI